MPDRVRGDCYEAAGRLFLSLEAEAAQALQDGKHSPPMGGHRPRLVHGMVHGQGPLEGWRIGHGWVEFNNRVFDHSNGRKVEVPISYYYDLGRITENDVVRYTVEEAYKKMVRHETWGPWESWIELKAEIAEAEIEIARQVFGKIERLTQLAKGGD